MADFLKLRLAIERAIRAKENMGSGPVRVAIIGNEKDEKVTVFINHAAINQTIKEGISKDFYCDPVMGYDGFQGSLTELVAAFNDHWMSHGPVYHLEASNPSVIQFGIFSPLEFQQLQSSSSASTTSTTLPSYNSTVNKTSNPFDSLPADSFKFHFLELNSLLRALQYYMTTRTYPEDMKLSYYPDFSGTLRLTAVIHLDSEREIDPEYERFDRQYNCKSFAECVAGNEFGFASVDGGPITGDKQYTFKGTSIQHIQLKMDASDVSMQKLRLNLLTSILPLGLDLGKQFITISFPSFAEGTCWTVTLDHKDMALIDKILGFLEKAGLKNVTSSTPFDKVIPKNPLEFIVGEPTPRGLHSGLMEQFIKINASPETFTAIINAMWEHNAPEQHKVSTLGRRG